MAALILVDHPAPSNVLPARRALAATCDLPPDHCPNSAPLEFIWTGTSHCDVDTDGRVWNTCDFIAPNAR